MNKGKQKRGVGLSVLFVILSIICIILVVVTQLFDQTFYILTGSRYAKVSDTSEDATYFASVYDTEEERLQAGNELAIIRTPCLWRNRKWLCGYR